MRVITKWGVPVLLLVALVCGSWLYFRRSGSGQELALVQRQEATRVLGEYLAQRFPGKRVLVISNPFTRTSGRARQIYRFEEAGIAGLKEGSGSKEVIKVVFPELRSGALEKPESFLIDTRTTTPLSFLMEENAFDRLAKENPGYDIWVSLIGLPVNIRQTEVWTKSASPAFALLLPDWRAIGSPGAVAEAFKTGKLAAAVVNLPEGSSPANAPVAVQDQNGFNKQFLLITPDNIEKTAHLYPGLF